MNGTTTFEMEPLLNLEMDFEFIPGSSPRLNCHPDLAEPGYDPDYDFQEIRVFHQGHRYQVPDWLFEILKSQFEMDLVDIVDQWLKDHPKRKPRRRSYGSRKYSRKF